jgi:hypothetical protein
MEQSGSYQQPSGTYSEPLSRQRRGLLVFLLDQSGSMMEEMEWQGSKVTLIHMATATINSLLVSVVNNATPDPSTGRRKDYCDIIIFGYGDSVTPLLNSTGVPVPLPDLAENPLGRHMVRIQKYDQLKKQPITFDEEQPYWIEPYANSNWTEMAGAISWTYQAVQNWLNVDTRRRLSFPPIVINITDGRHNGRSSGDPVQEAHKLRQIRTDDGAVLLFNCHITKLNTQKLIFPNDPSQINNLGLSNENRLGATQLLEMSSLVPATMSIRARQVFGKDLLQGARGFVYNGSGRDLINFLSWGTRQGREFIR